jgi:hypothetical protein
MKATDAEAREKLRHFWDRHPELVAALRANIRDPERRRLLLPPLMPPGYEGLTCGCKTRSGRPCKATKLWPPSYRCRNHGGLSTGPHDARAGRR